MTKNDDELCALDDLFKSSRLYGSSQEYMDLLNFITKFRKYAPFNCMLMHIQNPNISYVASAVDWQHGFNRYPKRNARPLVILQPFGPVMFLYDILDTEGDQVPDYVMKPFDTQGELPPKLMDKTIHNCGIHGIDVKEDINGLLKAGNARRLSDKIRSEFGDLNLSETSSYLILLNKDHSPEEQYSTLAHELGHILCGHIGVDRLAWWGTNMNISESMKEIEAESVAYLVCRRMDLIASSDKYLSTYKIPTEAEMPFFGLNAVFQATDYIEKMGESYWKKPKRKPKKEYAK
jgi:hypothetical protein